jgi:hypothetical protein
MDHMSIFNAGQTTPEITVDQLVGEGKKYANMDELAKAYMNADQFIGQLKTETEGLRTELNQRVAAETLFEKIVQARPEPSPPVAAPKEDPPVGDPNQTSVDLAQVVREQLLVREQEKTIQQNADEVTNRMIKEFGSEDKAHQVVLAKAQELGVSIEFLQDVAVKSPKAFYQTLGLTTTPTSVPSVSRGDVNTAALGTTSNGGASTYGTKEYFDALRRDNPSKYWTPAIQNQIFKATQDGTYKP